MPAAGHILNFCADRYRFAVVLCAAVSRGQLTLLPPTTTPNVIRAMRDFAPDAYYVTDDPAVVEQATVAWWFLAAMQPLAGVEPPQRLMVRDGAKLLPMDIRTGFVYPR